MSRADAGAQELGIPGGVLMERAGAAMARIALERYAPGRALVVSGGGNNGGDGFVIARELHRSGVDVAVLATKERVRGGPGDQPGDTAEPGREVHRTGRPRRGARCG